MIHFLFSPVPTGNYLTIPKESGLLNVGPYKKVNIYVSFYILAFSKFKMHLDKSNIRPENFGVCYIKCITLTDFGLILTHTFVMHENLRIYKCGEYEKVTVRISQIR